MPDPGLLALLLPSGPKPGRPEGAFLDYLGQEGFARYRSPDWQAPAISRAPDPEARSGRSR
jgi:hypothetical protein